jgi:hypothetical protein
VEPAHRVTGKIHLEADFIGDGPVFTLNVGDHHVSCFTRRSQAAGPAGVVSDSLLMFGEGLDQEGPIPDFSVGT